MRSSALLAALAFLAGGGCGVEKPHGRSTIRAGAPSPASAGNDAASAFDAAGRVYARGEYDSARAMFTRVRALAAASGDTLTEARALTEIGLAAWHLGDYAAARNADERAVALKIAAGLTNDLPKSYNALGLLAYNEGRYAEALDAYAQAVRTAVSTGDSAAAAKARGNAGLVYSDIGDFARARAGLDDQRRVAHARHDTIAEANAIGNLALVSIRSGEPRAAVPLATTALRLDRVVGNTAGEENALGQIGTAFEAMGEPQIAFAYLDSARAIARDRGMRQQETDDLQLIAEFYDEAGDHARALQYLERAAPVADTLGLLKIRGDILQSEARAYSALGDLRSARDRAAAASRFHGAAGSTLDQLEDELLIAQLAQRDGAKVDATTSIAAARRIAASIDSRVARASLGLGEARVAELAGDPRGVLAALGRVRPDLAAAVTGRSWEASALAARAYSSLGRFEDAVTAGRAAVREIERVRGNFDSGTLRASYTSERSSVYADLTLALLALDRPAEALRVADAGRSRALLEHLSAAGSARQPIGASSDLVAAEQLLRRIDQLVERLRAADTVSRGRRSRSDDEEAGFLSQQLLDARREYEALMQRARIADRRTAAIARGGLPSASGIRSALAPGESLIEYFVTRAKLVTFVVNAHGIRSLEAPVSDSALASRIRLACDLVSRRDIQPGLGAAPLRALYGMLIQPALDAGLLRGTTTLVIVPHAALSYVPFAALLDPISNRYLVQRFDLLTVPSASAFATVRHERPAAGTRLAGAEVFAPFVSELPGTRDEALAVERRVPSSRVYLGGDATEGAVRRALAGDRPVHLATHGILNARSPMFSRLELARAAGDTSLDDDGRLEVHELLDLTIRSPLVFLSGCETGAGTAWSTSFAPGEDYATLAEAFLFAGARNVIATLWRIEDRGAATFAETFYENAQHAGPVEALAAAQRALIADKALASPYYWAAYVISGDGGARAAQSRAGVSVE